MPFPFGSQIEGERGKMEAKESIRLQKGSRECRIYKDVQKDEEVEDERS